VSSLPLTNPDAQVAGNTDHYVEYAIQEQDRGNMTPYLQYVGLKEGQSWSTLDNLENKQAWSTLDENTATGS